VKYLPLIWSALWRKPVETLLTLSSIIAAFALVGLMASVDAATRQFIDSKRLDRLWVDARFFSESITGLPIGMSAQLSRIDGVSAVGATRWFGAYHVDPHDQVSVVAMDEGMKGAWSDGSVTPEQWDALAAKPSGLLISERAATVRHLKPGDRFTLITEPGTRADGGNSWDFEVLGIVPDEWEYSGNDGYMIANARSIDNALPPGRQGLGFYFQVAVRDAARAVEIGRQIDLLYENSGTPTQTITKRAQSQMDADRGVDIAMMTWSIASAGLLMILFLTGNAIARSVRERVPEFAVLQSMGFRGAHVMGLVFVEAAIPCIVGAVIGVTLSAKLAAKAKSLFGGNLAFFLDHWAPPWGYLLAVALGFSVLLAVAASVIPLRRLGQMSVTDALAGR
jgi:putative ABC transport system permease protein